MRIGTGIVLLLLVGMGVAAYRLGLLDRFSELGSLSEPGHAQDETGSWAQEALPSDPAFQEDPVFKETTTLTDFHGRALECQILAKRGATLAVRRNSDGGEFLIPLKNLSRVDQARFSEMSDHRTEVVHALEGGESAAAANRKAAWNGSLNEALSEAQSNGFPIYLLFTGTDW